MLLTSFLVSVLMHVCLGRHLESPPHVEPSLRIINGKDAVSHVAPYSALVVLQVAGVEAYCGGSLINEQFVLTSGSCLAAPETEIDRVGLGLYNFNQTEPVQEQMAASYAIHEAYLADKSTAHDVALIKLRRPFNITAGEVETVELPAAAAFPAARTVYEQRPATLYGWGATSDTSTSIVRVLQTLDVQVQTWKGCQSAGGAAAREDGLCVTRPDGQKGTTCKGDEGGPLMVAGIQVGVIGRAATSPCADNTVTFAARVDYHVDWIKKTMGQL